MKAAILKKVRVFLSLLFFILTSFLFVDFAGIFSARLIRAILYLQFIPSLLEFLRTTTLAAAGFLFILAITFLFGRLYCSSVCPLGTLFDLMLWIRNRTYRKKKFRFNKDPWFLRYGMLIIAVLILLSGNLLMFNLLDPFGLSGKVFSNLLRPAYYTGNNLLGWFLKLFDNYYFYPVPVKFVHLSSVLISSGLLTIFILLAVFRGRLYCNTLCPVGSILGLASKCSVYKISIDPRHCTSCGLCIRDCKAECIDAGGMKIDFSRCIACFNCMIACPEGGIKYQLRFRREEPGIIKPDRTFNEKRRQFLKTAVLGTSAILIGKAAFSNSNPKSVSQYPVTPPGSISIWHYSELCISCHLCVSECPTHVLQPTLAEFGLDGLFQPAMDYHTSYCNFECVRCSEICPSGAISAVAKEQKETIQIGISTFIRNLCVVVTNHTTCGACSEHCPTKAVEMVPYLGDLKIPQVDEKICIGCGACEYACPTKPEKAIYVESNLYHRKAQKPLKKVQDQEKPKKTSEDFPF